MMVVFTFSFSLYNFADHTLCSIVCNSCAQFSTHMWTDL